MFIFVGALFGSSYKIFVGYFQPLCYLIFGFCWWFLLIHVQIFLLLGMVSCFGLYPRFLEHVITSLWFLFKSPGLGNFVSCCACRSGRSHFLNDSRWSPLDSPLRLRCQPRDGISYLIGRNWTWVPFWATVVSLYPWERVLFLGITTPLLGPTNTVMETDSSDHSWLWKLMRPPCAHPLLPPANGCKSRSPCDVLELCEEGGMKLLAPWWRGACLPKLAEMCCAS